MSFRSSGPCILGYDISQFSSLTYKPRNPLLKLIEISIELSHYCKMLFFQYMFLELGPDMMYMDLRDSFYPYLVHLGFSKMGVASRAHF